MKTTIMTIDRESCACRPFEENDPSSDDFAGTRTFPEFSSFDELREFAKTYDRWWKVEPSGGDDEIVTKADAAPEDDPNVPPSGLNAYWMPADAFGFFNSEEEMEEEQEEDLGE